MPEITSTAATRRGPTRRRASATVPERNVNHVSVPVPTVTTEQLQAGVNVFPDMSPTLDADTDIPGANLGLTIQDGVKK